MQTAGRFCRHSLVPRLNESVPARYSGYRNSGFVYKAIAAVLKLWAQRTLGLCSGSKSTRTFDAACVGNALGRP